MSEDNRSHDVSVAGASRPTRWNQNRPPRPTPARLDGTEREERGGLYLAVFVAALLPILIVSALVLSRSDGNTQLETDLAQTTVPPSTNLDETGPAGDEVPDSDEPTANDDVDSISPDVAGATESADTPTSDSSEIAEGQVSADNDSSNGDGSGDPPAGSGTAALAADQDEGDAPATTRTTVAPTTRPPAGTSPITTARSQAPVVTPRPPLTTVRPTTTTTTAPPTTTTTEAPTTTTTTTTTEAPANLTLSRRIEIAQLGDTFVRIRFASSSTTSYRVSILGQGQVTATRTGTAVADQTVGVSIDGLTPGTDYNIQVALSGPPQFTSGPVAFRTSGGDPAPTNDEVEIINLRVVERQRTRIELNYESNVCANGSFVIRDGDGAIVGSNSGQASGCTTRHLAIPGFWTSPLEPNTSYEITVTVEAGGAGRGRGNVDTETITVRTSG